MFAQARRYWYAIDDDQPQVVDHQRAGGVHVAALARRDAERALLRLGEALVALASARNRPTWSRTVDNGAPVTRARGVPPPRCPGRAAGAPCRRRRRRRRPRSRRRRPAARPRRRRRRRRARRAPSLRARPRAWAWPRSCCASPWRGVSGVSGASMMTRQSGRATLAQSRRCGRGSDVDSIRVFRQCRTVQHARRIGPAALLCFALVAASACRRPRTTSARPARRPRPAPPPQRPRRHRRGASRSRCCIRRTWTATTSSAAARCTRWAASLAARLSSIARAPKPTRRWCSTPAICSCPSRETSATASVPTPARSSGAPACSRRRSGERARPR